MACLAILVLSSLIPPPGLTRMSRAEGVRWVMAAHRYVADDLSYIVLTGTVMQDVFRYQIPPLGMTRVSSSKRVRG